MVNFTAPGISFSDGFAAELAQRLQSMPVGLIGLPPGYKVSKCIQSLAIYADELAGYGFEYPYDFEKALSSRQQLLDEVAYILGLTDGSYASAEELVVTNISSFRDRQTIGLPVEAELSGERLGELIDVCRELAEFTKDLEGPLNFMLVVPFPAVARVEAEPLVWQPLKPHNETLSFDDPFSEMGMTPTRIEQRGFEIYLGLRLYWEAAGAPEAIERLAPIYDRRAFWRSRPDADQRINETFDDLTEGLGHEASQLEHYFESSIKNTARRTVFSTAILPNNGESRTDILVSGLVWIPPGGLHRRITPAACRCLTSSKKFVERWELSPPEVVRFRASARMNPLLATWVMSLSGLVEMEMLHYCKASDDLESCIDAQQLRSEFEELQRKAASEGTLGYVTDRVDHASFGQLQHLIFDTQLRRDFPLFRDKVDKIRRARNLVAHGHSVSWPQVRTLLSALATLHDR